jgi:hypothetical protein
MSGEGPPESCPTATQNDALTQESPKRMPWSTVGVLSTDQFDALTVAGTVTVVAPADVTPKRRHVPSTTADRADMDRRVKVVTVLHFPGPGVGPATADASWPTAGNR